MAKGMRERGRKTYERTNQELADKEAAVLLSTKVKWEELRPKIDEVDEEVWEGLIAAVEEATQHNKDLGWLKDRLQELGIKGMDLIKKVVKEISPV